MKYIFNIWVIVALVLFLQLQNLNLPGAYLDALNPDYLALHLLYPDNVPAWKYPDNIIIHNMPVLNMLYAIFTPGYLMLFWGAVFGYSLFSAYLAHIFYMLCVLMLVYFVTKSITKSKKLGVIAALLLGLDGSIFFGTRTQYYLHLFPHIFFLLGFYIVYTQKFCCGFILNKKFFIAGVLLGFSVAGYFIYGVYVLALLLALYIAGNNGNMNDLKKLIHGILLGYSPFIYGHFSMIVQAGLTNYFSFFNVLNNYGLSAGQSASLLERIVHLFTRLYEISGGGFVLQLMTGNRIAIIDKLPVINTFYSNVFFICACISLVYTMLQFFIYIKKDGLSVSVNSKMFLYVFFGGALIGQSVLSLCLGKTLGYQHFIMLLPILYLWIIYSFHNISVDIVKKFVNRAKVIRCCLCLLAVCSVISSLCFIGRSHEMLVATNGKGYYSVAINDIAVFCRENTKREDVIVTPQWGYWTSIAMVTEGQRKIIMNMGEEDTNYCIENSGKTGEVYIVVDSKTDYAMLGRIMKKQRLRVLEKRMFKDYGDVLRPEVWICEKNYI